MIGAVVVVAVGLCFRTPDAVRAEVARHERDAQLGRRSRWTCGRRPGVS